MSLVSTQYQPPKDLPSMRLTVKDGKLFVLDWFDDKTKVLLKKLGKTAVFVPSDSLNDDDINQRLAQQVIYQLDEYFAGSRQIFDIPLDLSMGTPFERLVWQTLQKIPYGQTISYATLATKIGKPTAFRACANANGKNPISLIVPCHRVIASSGAIGGYTGGIQIKQTLLALEQS